MKSEYVNRREFLQTAAGAGVVALAGSTVMNAFGAETKTKSAKKIFECGICGHIEFNAAPDICPICKSPKDKFQLSEHIFTESAKKFKDLTALHACIIKVKKKSDLVTAEPSISVRVKIGKPVHPVTDQHHIRFIDYYIDDTYVGCLLPSINSYPAGGIEIKKAGSKVRIVALCTLHGYWTAEAAV